MRLVIFSVFSLLLITTCFAEKNQLVLTDPGKIIVISNKSRYFTINLPATPSTGYSWRLKQYDRNFIHPVSQYFRKVMPPLPGAAGVISFSFAIDHEASQAKKVSQITFIYVRPWNLDIAKTVKFTIRSE